MKISTNGFECEIKIAAGFCCINIYKIIFWDEIFVFVAKKERNVHFIW